jgi:hypothetical protein
MKRPPPSPTGDRSEQPRSHEPRAHRGDSRMRRVVFEDRRHVVLPGGTQGRMMLRMARVRQVDPEGATPEQRRLFELDIALFGEPLSATRVYALRPDIFRHVHALHAALADGTRLPEHLVMRARRRVAEVHGSPF